MRIPRSGDMACVNAWMYVGMDECISQYAEAGEILHKRKGLAFDKRQGARRRRLNDDGMYQ